MYCHTLFLKRMLILCMLLFPSTLAGFIFSVSSNRFLTNSVNAFTYFILCLVLYFMDGIGAFKIFVESILLVPISILCGICCIVLEFKIGQLLIFISNKRYVKHFSIKNNLNSGNVFFDILFLVLGCFGEELIFRQAFFYVLCDSFSCSFLFVLLFSSFVYAINHIYYGKRIVIQKISSGLVFGILFYVSGRNILFPFLAHLAQNVFLYFMEKLQWKY